MRLPGGFPGGSDSQESACNVGDLGSIPGLGRFPGGEHGNPLQFSCPENPQWTEEPGGLQSVGSQRVRHDWMTKTFTFCFVHIIIKCCLIQFMTLKPLFKGNYYFLRKWFGAFNITPLKVRPCLFLTVQKNSGISRLHWTDPGGGGRGSPLILLFTGFYNPRE